MSLVVFLIAAVPALFVIGIGAWTKSRAATYAAAVIAALIGLIGVPAYIGIDLLAVGLGLGLWFGLPAIDPAVKAENERLKAERIAYEQTEQYKAKKKELQVKIFLDLLHLAR